MVEWQGNIKETVKSVEAEKKRWKLKSSIGERDDNKQRRNDEETEQKRKRSVLNESCKKCAQCFVTLGINVYMYCIYLYVHII